MNEDAYLDSMYEDRYDIGDPYDYDDAAYDGLDFGQDYVYDGDDGEEW